MYPRSAVFNGCDLRNLLSGNDRNQFRDQVPGKSGPLDSYRLLGREGPLSHELIPLLLRKRRPLDVDPGRVGALSP